MLQSPRRVSKQKTSRELSSVNRGPDLQPHPAVLLVCRGRYRSRCTDSRVRKSCAQKEANKPGRYGMPSRPRVGAGPLQVSGPEEGRPMAEVVGHD